MTSRDRSESTAAPSIGQGIKRRSWSNEDREEAVRRIVVDGDDVEEVAGAFGVKARTVHRWVQAWGEAESAAADVGPGAAPQPVHITASFELVDRVRHAVLRDIRERDGVHLVDTVYSRVAERIHDREEVRAAVDAALTSRLRLLVTAGSALILLLGFLGVTSLSSMVDAEARHAAEEAVKTKSEDIDVRIATFAREADESVKELRKSEDDAQRSFQDLLFGFQKKINEEVSDAREKIGDLAKNTNEGLAKLVDGATRRVEEVRNQATLRLDEDKVRHVEDLEVAKDRIFDELREARRNTLDKVMIASKDALTDIQQARSGTRIESTVGESDSITRRDPDEDTDATAVVLIYAERDFAALLPLAEKMLESEEAGTARGIVTPIFSVPDRFTPEQRTRAARVALDERAGPVDDRAGSAIEIAIAGARASDQAMIDLALGELESNAWVSVVGRALPDFAVAVARNEDDDDIRRKFRALKIENLTARGLTNVLSLAKLVPGVIPDDSLKEIESRILIAVTTTNYIDRMTDYPVAVMTARVLTQDPVFDRLLVKDALKRCDEYVLTNDRDPWGLGEIIEQFEIKKD